MPRLARGVTAAAETGQLAVLNKEGYLVPPRQIMDAVLASRGQRISLTDLSPDGRKFLITHRDGLPPLDRLGCPCEYLAEVPFDPVAYRSRVLWVNSAEGFDIFFPVDARTVRVKSPPGARVGSPVWSPDGTKLAFFAFFQKETHICIADPDTGNCRRITSTPVLATLVTSLEWSREGTSIHAVLLPNDRSRPMARPAIATEPKVRVARDGKDPSRTYRYLLQSPYQMRLLEQLCTGQLARIDVVDGTVTKVGTPAMISSINTSPDGKTTRVTTVKKPFSYYAPFPRFGSKEELWDREGHPLSILTEKNLREREPQPPTQINPTSPTGKGTRTKGAATAKGGGVIQPTPKQPPVDPDDPIASRGEPTDPDGKREIAWRPDGTGLSFLQLEQPGKDAKAVRKDRVMMWLPPFGKEDSKVVFESINPILSAQFSEDCKWIFITQTVEGQRQISAVDPSDPKAMRVISRSAPIGKSNAKKADATPKKSAAIKAPGDEGDDEEQPGRGRFGGAANATRLLTRSLGGTSAVRLSRSGEVYITGTTRGRGAEAGSFPRPYIDSIDIKSGKQTRIFEGKGDMLETIDAVDGDDIKLVFSTRQKPDVVPDSYRTELATGKVTKLTNNVDRTPWFHELKVERIRVMRVDGFTFSVKVTTPPKAKGKLPALFWIYPREYTDQAAYDASATRGGPAGGVGAAVPGRFNAPTPRSMSILTLAGYAVVEPDIPIVGPAGRMNDNYVPDLRNSLWAVIDELDKRGIIDRDRLAVGGHSYGAFSTANALAHTPFFKAGIAGDGCYNRTLTSMSFQTERRQLWDARETYLEMSPLLWADRVNGALLMYHGMEDQNVGTDPINSAALFAALDGLGKDAALYMYPYEGHGPIARETTLDLWARWIAWLDMYVKNPKKK
ncbi:MAG TPA: prolyl oligopeptidase family serine peptidase [Gemmata sp.]|nr:prolyl oligopeptidase family serine peptidase [Gemmata sp.]